MPVLALFFPVEVAIAATAVAHGAVGFMRLNVRGPDADRMLIRQFGLPAAGAAVAGAAVLGALAQMPQLTIYSLGQSTAVVTPEKLIIAALIFFFTLFEMLPSWRKLRFSRRYLPLGGMAAGFFGGLSGHQCVMRSVFLAKTGMALEVNAKTNTLISLLVDGSRLLVYILLLAWFAGEDIAFTFSQWLLLLTAVVAAAGGMLAGQWLFKKSQLPSVRYVTAAFLFIVALGLGVGLI